MTTNKANKNCCCSGCHSRPHDPTLASAEIQPMQQYCCACVPKQICVSIGCADAFATVLFDRFCGQQPYPILYSGEIPFKGTLVDLTFRFEIEDEVCYFLLESYALGVAEQPGEGHVIDAEQRAKPNFFCRRVLIDEDPAQWTLDSDLCASGYVTVFAAAANNMAIENRPDCVDENGDVIRDDHPIKDLCGGCGCICDCACITVYGDNVSASSQMGCLSDLYGGVQWQGAYGVVVTLVPSQSAQSWSVEAGEHDAYVDYQSPTVFQGSSATLRLGDHASHEAVIALHWDTDIPQGANIRSATVTLTPSETDDDGVVARIKVVEDPSVAMPTDTDSMEVARAAATPDGDDVLWELPAATDDVPLQSEGFVDALQRLVDKPSFSGRVIVLLDGRPSALDAERFFHSFEGDYTKAPVLEVTHGSGCCELELTGTGSLSIDEDSLETAANVPIGGEGNPCPDPTAKWSLFDEDGRAVFVRFDCASCNACSAVRGCCDELVDRILTATIQAPYSCACASSTISLVYDPDFSAWIGQSQDAWCGHAVTLTLSCNSDGSWRLAVSADPCIFEGNPPSNTGVASDSGSCSPLSLEFNIKTVGGIGCCGVGDFGGQKDFTITVTE